MLHGDDRLGASEPLCMKLSPLGFDGLFLWIGILPIEMGLLAHRELKEYLRIRLVYNLLTEGLGKTAIALPSALSTLRDRAFHLCSIAHRFP